MQRMYPGDLERLVSANEALTGLFLERIRQLSLVDFLIEFNKQRNIFISLNSEGPFIVFDANVEDFPSGGELHSFGTDLRHFVNGRLTSLHQPQNDMILALEFSRRNNILETEKVSLYIELIPRHPQAVLTDEKGTILTAFRYNNERGKDGRLIRRGVQYYLPPKLENITTKIQTENDLLITYLNEYGLRIKKQNYREIYVFLEHNIKRRTRLIANFKNDLTKLEDLPTLYRQASMLLTQKPTINAEYVDIYGESVKVDPRYNAVQNAELIFKKAKKIKKSEKVLQTKIGEEEEKIAYYEQILHHLNATNDPGDIALIYEELALSKKPRKKREVAKLNPYYIMYKDITIFFGKNNKQNDYLTFKIAKKNDTFMHIKNIPGSHIIINSPNPTKEVLLFAANLALFLSKKPDGEVTYTKVNAIKKGGLPGQVIMRNEQTIFVRYNEESAALFKNEIRRSL